MRLSILKIYHIICLNLVGAVLNLFGWESKGGERS